MTDNADTDLMARALAETERQAAEHRAALQQAEADRAQLLAADADRRHAEHMADQWAEDVRRAEHEVRRLQRAVLHWQHHLAMIEPADTILALYQQCIRGDARDTGHAVLPEVRQAAPHLRKLADRAEHCKAEHRRVQAELATAQAALADLRKARPQP